MLINQKSKIMERIALIFAMIFIAVNALAQTPQAFKYQAVARDNAGNILANQNVSFKISILKGSATNFAVYVETFDTVTNQFGLVNIEIGNGNVVYGVFANINWRDGLYFIQTEMDEAGGTNYKMMGATQLLPVPYSLYSGLSGSLLLTDENGNNYTLGVDTMGNLTTTLMYKWKTCGDTLIDSRDGQKYATVLIGSQCWMDKNLNIGLRIEGTSDQTDNYIIEKYCYDNLEYNCDTYGGLFQWDELMQYTTSPGVQGICPPDWHVPTDEEWKQLEGEADSYYGYPDPEWDNTLFRGFDVGLNLKSTANWASGGNGTDLYAFTAIPGGHRDDQMNFFGTGYYCTFWSSDETYSGNHSWFRRLISPQNEVNRYYYVKSYGFSVRCLKD